MSVRVRHLRVWLLACVLMVMQTGLIFHQNIYIKSLEAKNADLQGSVQVQDQRHFYEMSELSPRTGEMQVAEDRGGMKRDFRVTNGDRHSGGTASGAKTERGDPDPDPPAEGGPVPLMKTPARGADDTRGRDVQRAVSQADRLALSADTCRLHGREISGDVERVYLYEAAKVAYCSTHKIASTYWTRIFRWLYNDTRVGHVPSPLDISKLETHLLPFKKLRVRDVARNYQDRALVEASYRFLFTREPFARLWSVYIDKFLLPDNYFWSYYSPRVKASVYGAGDRKGRPIHRSPAVDVAGDPMGKRNASAQYQPNGGSLRTLRAVAFLRGAKPESSNSRTVWKSNGIPDTRVVHQPHSIKTNRHRLRPECLDVTFGEFIRYIVNVAGESTGQALDDHFRPIHYGCNPCKFQPHFIGRMESMRVDSGTVLGRMGLAHLLPELDASNHVQQEINMLIDFNYELVVIRGYQRYCVTGKDLERRLIKAFVYNGYIPEESEIVLNRGLPMGRERLKKAVTKMYEQSNRTSADIKRQRAKFKTEAYKEIPLDVLYSLQKVFHWDFELFGYDALPSEFFQR